MKKIVGIISGEPNSINSEIIAKTWKRKEKFGQLNFFIIGNFNLLKKQFKSMGYNFNLKKIDGIKNQNFEEKVLSGQGQRAPDQEINFENNFEICFLQFPIGENQFWNQKSKF